MKIYYNGKYKTIDKSGRETIFNKLEDIPDYRHTITEVEIEKGITDIYNKAFYNCIKIQSINIPEGVVKIWPDAFYLCSELKTVHLPNSIIEIGSDAFANCESLESIHLPDSINKINSGVFRGCVNLNEINIPDNITKIEKEVFKNTLLKSVVLPEGIIKIEEEAFCGCCSLEEINIPEKEEKIGRNAFEECSSLTTINIPKSVREIDYLAFAECLNLKNIIFDENIPKIKFNAFVLCDLDKKVQRKLIYQIAKNIELYEIPDLFNLYSIEYDSELIQELMTINIKFFEYANDADQNVFIDAVVDSINNIYNKRDKVIIETDLCNIKIKGNDYYLYLEENENNLVKLNNYLNAIKIIEMVNHYYEKEELDR